MSHHGWRVFRSVLVVLVLGGCGSGAGGGGDAPVGREAGGGIDAGGGGEAGIGRGPGEGWFPGEPARAPVAVAMPVGSVAGEIVTETIGPEGGSISTSDFRFEAIIPEGALEDETDFTVTVIANTAPGGFGAGYRVEPQVTLSRPARIKVTLGEEELGQAAPERVRVATQGEDGIWRLAGIPTIGLFGSMFTIEARHFSDWAPVVLFGLAPTRTSLKPGESTSFEFRTCHAVGWTAGEAEPQYECAADINLYHLTKWSATAGSVDQRGRYTAPDRVPSPNPVIVQVRVEGGGAAQIVLAEVEILGPGDYTLSVDHTSQRPGLEFKGRIEGELYLKSGGQSRFYAFRGTASVRSEIDIGEALCRLANPSQRFDTGSTTLLQVDRDGGYTLAYVFPVESRARCIPKDPDDKPFDIPHMVAGLTLMPSCWAGNTFTLDEDLGRWAGSATDGCSMSSASWVLIPRR